MYYLSVSKLDYFCWHCYVLNENFPRNFFLGEHQYEELKEDHMNFRFLPSVVQVAMPLDMHLNT